VTWDAVKKPWPTGRNGNGNGAAHESFASVLRRGLGATICRDFYFPYARKIWGLDPEELSAIQARRRVRAGSLGRLVKKVLAAVPGLRAPGGGRFYYPRRGFGQIGQRLLRSRRALKGRSSFSGPASRPCNLSADGIEAVEYRAGDEVKRLQPDYVWSTIPINALVQRIRPAAPPEVLHAADQIRYRGMLLVYLVLGQTTLHRVRCPLLSRNGDPAHAPSRSRGITRTLPSLPIERSCAPNCPAPRAMPTGACRTHSWDS